MSLSDQQQIETIKSQALAQLADLRANPKPTYNIDGQQVLWESYIDSLQKTVDWCDVKLTGYEPFEFQNARLHLMTAFDASTDLAIVADQLETITLRRPGSTGSQSVAAALRRLVTIREAEASGGKYSAGDVRWHLPAAGLNKPPQLGDRIVDATGITWTILELRRSEATNRWACATRNLAVAAGLDDLICIERAAWIKGAAGAVTPQWVELAAGLPARIQPVASQAETHQDRRACRTTYRVFVAEPLAIGPWDRVVDARGCTYRVTGCTQPERIDGLLVIEAERIM